jgi:NADH-ubiquinone oxidoreductase chain 6
MLNLYVLKETFFNGYNMEFISFLYFSSIISGIFVIISKNPVISILFLIGLFLSISGYLIILGMNFIGLSYILVYVGAVSILFLFILMLINVRISELLSYTNNTIPLALIIGIVFMYSIYEIFPNYKIYINLNLLNDFIFNNDEIMYVTSIT